MAGRSASALRPARPYHGVVVSREAGAERASRNGRPRSRLAEDEIGADADGGRRAVRGVAVEAVEDLLRGAAAEAADGVETREAASLDEVLAMLEAHPDIDLVLLDLHMDDMNGWEVLGAIRDNPRFTKTKVVVVTGSDAKVSPPTLGPSTPSMT